MVCGRPASIDCLGSSDVHVVLVLLAPDVARFEATRATARTALDSWVWEEHAAILDALEAGDEQRAKDLARGHAEHGERLILEGMASSIHPAGQA